MLRNAARLRHLGELPAVKYKETAERHGYEASPDKLGWALPIYVSDSHETARREAKPHVEAMFNKFLRMPQEYLLPPRYTSVASMKRLRQAKSTTTSDVPLDPPTPPKNDRTELRPFVPAKATPSRDRLHGKIEPIRPELRL